MDERRVIGAPFGLLDCVPALLATWFTALPGDVEGQ